MSTSAPLITAIVPTYRRPQLLRRAVLSILNQSYQDFAVLIMDNASGDDTAQVAQELMRRDPRVRYHRHAENIGSLQNMIFGMAQVATPYFSILCDDDVLMPDFFRVAMEAHRQAEAPLAFAATRVIVVDGQGTFAAPWAHPGASRTVPPPDGVLHCLAGISLPGVLYRTMAMRAVGAPRVPWWNWTESGWHALAAVASPVGFCPEVGAIVYVHPTSASKRMDRVEFRVSWFRMVAEVRAAAGRAGVPASWWTAQMLPLVRARFTSTVARLFTPDGVRAYDEMRTLGVTSGLSPLRVSAIIGLARVAHRLGVGALVNAVCDWWVSRMDYRTPPPEAPASAVQPLDATVPSRVFHDLNRQAGLPTPG